MLQIGFIAVAITLRTFLWGRRAPPQKCPRPNRCDYSYKSGSVQRGFASLESALGDRGNAIETVGLEILIQLRHGHATGSVR
jgi:hypothetical protein